MANVHDTTPYVCNIFIERKRENETVDSVETSKIIINTYPARGCTHPVIPASAKFQK